MSPTMRRLSGRSTRSSTSFPSSRIAIRVSRGAALMRISLFIVARLPTRSATRRVKRRTVQKSPRGRATGPRYEFLGLSLSAPLIHVPGPRESRGRPMRGEQHSVRTIYRQRVRFRNSDNNLRRLTCCAYRTTVRISYVTRQSEPCHGPIYEPHHDQNVREPGLPLAVLHVEFQTESPAFVWMGRLPRRRTR